MTSRVNLTVVVPADVPPAFSVADGRRGSGQKVFHYLQPHDGDVLDWDFGDGAHSTETDPVHTYAGFGHYAVRLTVTDANGHQSTTSMVVPVRMDVPGQPPSALVEAVLQPWVVFTVLAVLAAAGAGVAFTLARRRKQGP